MRRAIIIEKEAGEINTIEGLTNVFESIASTQIAKVKTKEEMSKEFFQKCSGSATPPYVSTRQ